MWKLKNSDNQKLKNKQKRDAEKRAKNKRNRAH